MNRPLQAFCTCLLLLALCASSSAPAMVVPAASLPPSYADAPEVRRLLHWEHFPLHVYFVPSDLATKKRTDAAQAGFD